MMRLKTLYPDLTWGEIEAICLYWRVFYESPMLYRETELEKMVFDWLKTPKGKEVVKKYNRDSMR